MIKKAMPDDAGKAAELAVLLWPDNTLCALTDEFRDLMLNGKAQFFLKYERDTPVGFAQCGLRYDYVEGTSSSPIGYLEGIFVKEEHRRKGYGKELLSECEKWSRAEGCLEFASDCEADNVGSFNFHKAVNFNEANRIICFTKRL